MIHVIRKLWHLSMLSMYTSYSATQGRGVILWRGYHIFYPTMSKPIMWSCTRIDHPMLRKWGLVKYGSFTSCVDLKRKWTLPSWNFCISTPILNLKRKSLWFTLTNRIKNFPIWSNIKNCLQNLEVHNRATHRRQIWTDFLWCSSRRSIDFIVRSLCNRYIARVWDN